MSGKYRAAKGKAEEDENQQQAPKKQDRQQYDNEYHIKHKTK